VQPGWQTVEIDGRRFAVRRIPGLDGGSLEVERSTDDHVRLRPWTHADHLDALDRHAYHDGAAPRLEPAGLAAEVLARTSSAPLPPAIAEDLAPLALWWAAGGDEAVAELPQPRPWTGLARARALDAHTDPSTGALRVGGYLAAMIDASAGPLDLHALRGAAAAAVLDAVTRVNAPIDDLAEGPGSIELARTTLRLCRALGWTPAQVWATPAVELDRLLALLDRMEAPPAPRPVQPGRSGLAAYPDAVIIQVGEG
jgi:hypothetical protein